MSRAMLRPVLGLRTSLAPLAPLAPTFLLQSASSRAISTTTTKTTTTIPSPTPSPSPSPSPSAIKTAKQEPPPIHPRSSLSAGPPSTYPFASTYKRVDPPPPKPAEASRSISELLPLLRAQPGHYITAHIHARPYLVTQGDQIRLPFKMPGVVPGDVLRLDRASVIGSRDYTLKGSPYIDPKLFECRATVLGTESEPMRVKIKKKRRSRRAQRVTSKHKYTILCVSELKILGPSE
ncbi:ribosomal protein L21-like protein [Xylaria sp. CBS 124048]|nr:ribosomal protein L21-like protein [Xylaria sp. CBS 124048]